MVRTKAARRQPADAVGRLVVAEARLRQATGAMVLALRRSADGVIANDPEGVVARPAARLRQERHAVAAEERALRDALRGWQRAYVDLHLALALRPAGDEPASPLAPDGGGA